MTCTPTEKKKPEDGKKKTTKSDKEGTAASAEAASLDNGINLDLPKIVPQRNRTTDESSDESEGYNYGNDQEFAEHMKNVPKAQSIDILDYVPDCKPPWNPPPTGADGHVKVSGAPAACVGLRKRRLRLEADRQRKIVDLMMMMKKDQAERKKRAQKEEEERAMSKSARRRMKKKMSKEKKRQQWQQEEEEKGEEEDQIDFLPTVRGWNWTRWKRYEWVANSYCLRRESLPDRKRRRDKRKRSEAASRRRKWKDDPDPARAVREAAARRAKRRPELPDFVEAALNAWHVRYPMYFNYMVEDKIHRGCAGLPLDLGKQARRYELLQNLYAPPPAESTATPAAAAAYLDRSTFKLNPDYCQALGMLIFARRMQPDIINWESPPDVHAWTNKRNYSPPRRQRPLVYGLNSVAPTKRDSILRGLAVLEENIGDLCDDIVEVDTRFLAANEWNEACKNSFLQLYDRNRHQSLQEFEEGMNGDDKEDRTLRLLRFQAATRELRWEKRRAARRGVGALADVESELDELLKMAEDSDESEMDSDDRELAELLRVANNDEETSAARRARKKERRRERRKHRSPSGSESSTAFDGFLTPPSGPEEDMNQPGGRRKKKRRDRERNRRPMPRKMGRTRRYRLHMEMSPNGLGRKHEDERKHSMWWDWW